MLTIRASNMPAQGLWNLEPYDHENVVVGIRVMRTCGEMTHLGLKSYGPHRRGRSNLRRLRCRSVFVPSSGM